jgi:hypothetical protein
MYIAYFRENRRDNQECMSNSDTPKTLGIGHRTTTRKTKQQKTKIKSKKINK